MIVNVPLLKNPINWVIVFLMLVIAGILGHLGLKYFGVTAETGPSSSALPKQVTPTNSPVHLRADGAFQPVESA